MVANDICTTDPKQIMMEIRKFYVDLYDRVCCDCSGLSTDEYLRKINTKVLMDEQQGFLDNKITTNEYFEALKSFETNKTPENDGLTGILSRLLEPHGEMSCQCLKFHS